MTKSRGINESHGMRGTKTYQAWCNMKTRCTNSNYTGAAGYSELDISYDPRWEYFSNFYADMGGCAEHLQLDRIDNNGHYSKENCRWTDRTTNIRNSSATKLTARRVLLMRALLKSVSKAVQKSYSYTVIGDVFGVSRSTVQRINAGLLWKSL